MNESASEGDLMVEILDRVVSPELALQMQKVANNGGQVNKIELPDDLTDSLTRKIRVTNISGRSLAIAPFDFPEPTYFRGPYSLQYKETDDLDWTPVPNLYPNLNRSTPQFGSLSSYQNNEDFSEASKTLKPNEFFIIPITNFSLAHIPGPSHAVSVIASIKYVDDKHAIRSITSLPATVRTK